LNKPSAKKKTPSKGNDRGVPPKNLKGKKPEVVTLRKEIRSGRLRGKNQECSKLHEKNR